MSYCHSPTGYHVVARQQWHFLLLWAICLRETEGERGVGGERCHMCLYSMWRLAVHIQISHHPRTRKHTHIYTRAQKPKSPGVWWQAAIVSMSRCNSVSHSLSLALSSLHVFPSSLPHPPPSLLPLSTSSSTIGFFFSCSSEWRTSLIPSTLSRSSSLKASPVVLSWLWKVLEWQLLQWDCYEYVFMSAGKRVILLPVLAVLTAVL